MAGWTTKKHDEGIKNKAFAMFAMGIGLPRIAAETGLKLATLKTWHARGGWKNHRTQMGQRIEEQAERAVSLALDSGKHTRDTLSRVVKRASDTLESIECAPTARAVREVADATKSLVDSAKILHGWESQSSTSLVWSASFSSDLDTQGDPPCIHADVVDAQVVDAAVTTGLPTTQGPPVDTTGRDRGHNDGDGI